MPPDAELMQAMTGGFPLYVIEAVRAMADPGSVLSPTDDLAGVLRNRLEQATPTAREIAGLASAVGRDFSLDLLTEASDLDADDVVRAVDELWGRRILHELSDGYDFSHDLLRETAYEQVSPPRRWLLHRRLAQGMELLHADNIDAISAQLAEQYARGGRAERAVDVLPQGCRGGRGALRAHRGDPAAARGPPADPRAAAKQQPRPAGARDPRGHGGSA